MDILQLVRDVLNSNAANAPRGTDVGMVAGFAIVIAVAFFSGRLRSPKGVIGQLIEKVLMVVLTLGSILIGGILGAVVGALLP